MARFGVEAIRYFDHARAANVDTAGDRTHTFDRANGLDAKLRAAGHTRAFYWANTAAFEADLRGGGRDGADRRRTGDVDLVWIETHGGHDGAGRTLLLYDTPATGWLGNAAAWRLGDDWNNEWLMVYGCDTVALDAIAGLSNVFARLHVYCGACGLMWDGIATDGYGQDVADNLIHGDPVAHAWQEGVCDGWLDNHPVSVCAGDAATWNGGDVRWASSALNVDRLWGHGDVTADLPPEAQACLLWMWTEG